MLTPQPTANMQLANKCKSIPIQAWKGPEGSRKLGAPRFQTNQHKKVVWLSVLHQLPTWNYSWYSFTLKAESTPGP